MSVEQVENVEKMVRKEIRRILLQEDCLIEDKIAELAFMTRGMCATAWEIAYEKGKEECNGKK